MKVSVIIPIYKVENFMERCARSLFEQTLKEDVEFILWMMLLQIVAFRSYISVWMTIRNVRIRRKF